MTIGIWLLCGLACFVLSILAATIRKKTDLGVGWWFEFFICLAIGPIYLGWRLVMLSVELLELWSAIRTERQLRKVAAFLNDVEGLDAKVVRDDEERPGVDNGKDDN